MRFTGPLGFKIPALKSIALLLLLSLTACDRNEVKVYQIAKDTSGANAEAAAGHNHGQPGTGAAAPTLEWQVPAGWEEAAPGEMRFASFKVKGKDGKAADVGIFPLPGRAGSDLDNVNRWRGQVGQPPVSQEELDKMTQLVEFQGQQAKVYDQAGENQGSGEKTRILAAIVRREGMAWFFKMMGDDGLVADQKPAFIAFIKSLKFGTSEQPQLPPSHPPIDSAMPLAQADPAAAATSGAKPQWTVPSGWKEAAAGQFLAAKFVVPGENNAQAAVNVSMSVGQGGGLAANVNRWRAQVGLGELSPDEVDKTVTQIDVPGGKASIVEMSGKDARTGAQTRVVGAMVPRGDTTWFYKLMGPDDVVGAHRDTFLKFIQSAKYPNA